MDAANTSGKRKNAGQNKRIRNITGKRMPEI